MVIVAIECASWYQREDGLIQVITIRGKTVILNRSYSKVWLAIDDEIYRENLIEKMKDLIVVQLSRQKSKLFIMN